MEETAEDTYAFLEHFANGGSLQMIAVAVVLLAATVIVSHIVTAAVRRFTQLDGVALPSSSILVNIGRIVIWGVGIGLILSICFDVDVNALIAALGVGGIAVSLGLQDTIKNFIGGLQVTLMGIVRPGDHIIVGGVEGIVQDVTWRQTVVKDYEGVVHIIPNSVINSTTVSKVEPEFLVTSVVVLNNDGRDIDDMLREMEEKARLAVQAVAPMVRNPWMLVTQVGEYGIWCKMRFVLADSANAREARDAALRAVAPYTRNNSSDMLSTPVVDGVSE
ncbi:MAG: mechanosensitive ion channel [Coriobacteriaceae bacterium]|nr:mechanosensitive ion channel [Coriobacteriaceae bacterium]